MIEQLGYKKVTLTSDSEPAIVASKEAVNKNSDVEAIIEEVLISDHQANRLVENAVKNVQGHLREIKDALENRRCRRVAGEHHVVAWMVMYAASVISRRWEDSVGAQRIQPVARQGVYEARGGAR